MEIFSSSEAETRGVAVQLAAKLKKGDVVLLEGPLGAGKTVFVKGVLQGLGFSRDEARSPTFTLVRQYRRRKITVYHLDLYRICCAEELVNLGYEEYLYSPPGITLVEWAEKIEGIESDFIRVKIAYKGRESRSIRIDFRNHPEFTLRNHEIFRD